MGEYYVYTNTSKYIGCPKFDKVDDAIKKYLDTEMHSMTDNVFLGYESGRDLCFDIVHMFFNESVLINDYLNHDEEEVRIAVDNVKRKLFMRYQWTHEIMDGVLIDYEGGFAPCMGTAKGEFWNEAYVHTLVDNKMETVGWIKPTRENFNKYGWAYPKIASYVSMMNVPVYDDQGYRHDVDIDPRAYLQLVGKKVSI